VTDRIYSFVGLAMKAGKLVSGEVNCEKALKNGKAFFVIVTADASGNTKKKFENACKYRDIPFSVFGAKEMLGRLLGKETRSVAAVTDVQFAGKLMGLVADQQSYGKIHGGELIE